MGYFGLAACFGAKDHLAIGKRAEERGGEKTVFTQQQQIFLMQGGDDALAVLARHLGLDNDGYPIVVGLLARLDAVHGETAGKTGDTAKDRLERLGLVVRDKVFVHLDHGDPALRLVGNARLSTGTHDHGVAHHAVGERLHGFGVDHCVGVDHEAQLEKVGRDAHERMHLAEEIVVERRHAIVVGDTLEKVHEDHLRVALATIAWLGIGGLFGGTTLDDDDHGRTSTGGTRIVAGVDHGHVVLLFARGDRDKAHGDWRTEARIGFQQRDADVGGAHRLAGTGDHAVGNDKEKLALVRVVGF